jgi:hypothetical protein
MGAVAADLLRSLCLPLIRRQAWVSAARLYGRVSVPRKTCLKGTMPAFVKSRLGSFWGTSGRSDDRVAVLAEEVEEALPDLIPSHRNRYRLRAHWPSRRGAAIGASMAAARASDGALGTRDVGIALATAAAYVAAAKLGCRWRSRPPR